MYNKNQSPIINIELRSIWPNYLEWNSNKIATDLNCNEYFKTEKYNFCDKCELTICNSMQHNEFISYDLES